MRAATSTLAAPSLPFPRLGYCFVVPPPAEILVILAAWVVACPGIVEAAKRIVPPPPGNQAEMNRSVPEQPGLTSKEAMARLAHDGYNELPSAKPRKLWAIAWEVVREPMFLLLIGVSAIYLVLGDIREALVLSASVVVVMGISFCQERKTERALEALRELSSPRAQVLRDGQWKSVPGREVVPGDVVRVKEGDRVPADAALFRSNNLMADESLLTGESVPVRKRAGSGDPALKRPGGDDLPFDYSGTLLTQGQGLARVVAAGVHTEIGKIGKALQTLVPELSTIQRDTRRAVLIFAVIGLALSGLVTVLYAHTRSGFQARSPDLKDCRSRLGALQALYRGP